MAKRGRAGVFALSVAAGAMLVWLWPRKKSKGDVGPIVVYEGEAFNRRYAVAHLEGRLALYYVLDESVGSIRADDTQGRVILFPSVDVAIEAAEDIILGAAIQEYQDLPCYLQQPAPEGFGCFVDQNSPTGHSLKLMEP